MSSPVLVAAQCAVQAGDLAANLALHLDFMRRAAEQGARLIVFPELSLSGYEPALASALASLPTVRCSSRCALRPWQPE